MTVMLYKHPGPVDLPQHGGSFETVIVNEGDVTGMLANGWHRTTQEALAADVAHSLTLKWAEGVGGKTPDLTPHDDPEPKPKRKYTRRKAAD